VVAGAVAVRTSGEPAARGSFAVPSATMPGESWVVEWVGEGACWCGCPAFARKQSCRHVQAVALAVEIEAREAVARSTPETRAEAAGRLLTIEKEFACD
jgi:hypothetical protein